MTYPGETPDLESSTAAYARRFEGPVGRYFLETQSNVVLQLLPPPQGCRVLDIGGGHGQLAGPLVEAGYSVSVFGSDEACRPRLDDIVGKGRYEYLQGSLLDLPFRDNSFDVVLAFRLMPHLNNWRRFVGEMCRVARGCLVIDYPDLRSVNILSSPMFAIKRGVEENTRTFRCFRRKDILSELSKHRFRHQRLRGQFLFPMAFHRLMNRATVSRLIERAAWTCGLTRIFGSPVILKAAPLPNC